MLAVTRPRRSNTVAPMRCLPTVLVIGLTALASAAVFALPREFLNNNPLLMMSDADKKLQYQAVLDVLEGADPRGVREWQNAATGFSGRIEAQGDMTSVEGLRCRRLQLRTELKGMQSVFAFPFCKDPQGKWFIASGMTFDEASKPR